MMQRSGLSYFVAAAVLLLLLMSTSTSAIAKGHEGEGQPEFVLVHGASSGAWCWFKVLTGLEDRGYKVTAMDLAGMGRDKTPTDQITSVAQYAKPLTDLLANASGKVILVGHSLGGISISHAMELYSEKITKAVFVTACMPRNNQSALETFPQELFPSFLGVGLVVLKFGNGPTALPTSFGVNSTLAPDFILNETPKELVNLGLSLLSSNPFAPLVERLTLTPEKYGRVRRFFIVAGKDALFDPDSYQKPMIEANGPVEQTFYIKDSDHCTFFSEPKELIKVLRSIATV